MSAMVDGEALGNQTITVKRSQSSSEDDYGVPISSGTVDHTIGGCSLQPMIARNVTTENVTSVADQIVSRWHLFAPAGSDLASADRVILGDLDLQVDGDPSQWAADDYGDGHVEAFLKRWRG